MYGENINIESKVWLDVMKFKYPVNLCLCYDKIVVFHRF